MVNYTRSRKVDLRQFAKSRGLRVRSRGKRANLPLKRDFIGALEAQDATSTFRFLDLPPELRNMVYRDVLAIEGSSSATSSPKCHPQILRTSKQINEEATSVLYGDNTIEIKIYATGIFAHGLRCGTYQPHANIANPPDRKAKNIVWPAFLSRVRSIRVILVDSQRGPPGPQHPPNFGSLHNTLFSLCQTLQRNSTLRSILVHLSELTASCVGSRRRDLLDEYPQLAVYPLRMLDKRVVAVVTGTDPLVLPRPLAPNLKAVEIAMETASSSVHTVLHHMRTCVRLDLLIQPQPPSGGIWPEPVLLVAD